ncbi:uncharacterized protein LOC135501741 isoform X2 [Lineus longissimus]|uniref:uncharacterized protein LOC135501741 isoform X2 n=1 Tax=Lineus longissimus TaxID=88925 RepID=UPI002B4D1304
MTTDIDTIRKWSEGEAIHDQGKYQEAIDKFEQVREPNHKILFNIGCDFLCTGLLKRAVEAFRLCVQKDTNLAIGYFQCGICYHKLQKYRDAALYWNFALERVQGKKVINYSPLGLRYHLYECEIRHNLALTLLYLGDYSEASRVLQDAIRLQVTLKHKAMFTPAAESCKNGLAFPLIEIPVNAIFRPDRALVANMSKKDYLGKAKVVAALDDDKTTGFSGIQLMAENDGKIPIHRVSPQPRRKKGLLSRSLDNILGVDDSDMKKVTSKSSENVLEMDGKKGSNVCVGIQRERYEFLRQNVPQNAPPRPPLQHPAPKLKPTQTQARDVPTILPPQKIVRQQALKKSRARDASGKTVSPSKPEVSRAIASDDVPRNEFDVKWKCLHDNQSRGQAWKFDPPNDANFLASRRTSAPTVHAAPKITVSFENGKRSQSLVPEVHEDNDQLYVNLPLRPKCSGTPAPELLDSGGEFDNPPYLQLVGGYSGLDQENIEEASYADLKPEENLYEEVGINLKAKLGCTGAKFGLPGPSAMSICSCRDNMDFDGTDNYYSTPGEEYYEDVDAMELPDDAQPFRPIKRKRRSRTTDDLPKRTIQERNVATQFDWRAQVAKTCSNKTTDDLPKKAPRLPKGPGKPGRPPQPKLLSNPCTIPQAGSINQERPVSPVSPGRRDPPNRPPPRLSPEAVRPKPLHKPSSPKQFSSDLGAQWLKGPDQVTSGNVQQQQRRVSEGSYTVDRKASDCTVKVQKPQRPSLPEGGFAAIKLKANIRCPVAASPVDKPRKISGQTMLQTDQISELAQVLQKRMQKSYLGDFDNSSATKS